MRTRLGQNFLQNEHIASKIVEAAGITSDDIVVEIGPGRGILTEKILKKNPRKLIALELDKELAGFLNKKFLNENNHSFIIINDDALKTDYERLIYSFCDDRSNKSHYHDNYEGEKKRAIFIGNLPYCSATAILKKLLPGNFWKRAVFMFQKEVGERILAISGQSGKKSAGQNFSRLKDIGYLSIFAAYYSRTEAIIPMVKPGAFSPMPKVSSMVLGFEPTDAKNRYPAGSLLEEKIFFEVAGAAFSNRRKNILNSFHLNLKKRIAQQLQQQEEEKEGILLDPKISVVINQLNDKDFISDILVRKAGIDPLKRAEQLHFDDFKKITSAICSLISTTIK